MASYPYAELGNLRVPNSFVFALMIPEIHIGVQTPFIIHFFKKITRLREGRVAKVVLVILATFAALRKNRAFPVGHFWPL